MKHETETYVELDMVAGGEQLEGARTCRYAYVHDECGCRALVPGRPGPPLALISDSPSGCISQALHFNDSALPKNTCLGAAMTVRCSGTLLGKLSGQHLATSAGAMPIYILQELARLYETAWRMTKSSTHSPFANCK